MDPLLPYHVPDASDLPTALGALRGAGILRALSRLGPVIAGTFPLDLNLPESDVDVLCRLQPASLFRAAAQSISRLPGYSLRASVRRGRRTAVCRVRPGRLPLEIFAQSGPLRSQRGYRHLEVEYRLLSLCGGSLREGILKLRRADARTEPPFAQLLRLRGDPHDALERLASSPDAALRELLHRALGDV